VSAEIPLSSASHADTRSSNVALRPRIAMSKLYRALRIKVQKPAD
jgi:hypothetical protein